MTPEQIISHALDGTFVQIDREGNPHLAFVEKDFLPNYRSGVWPLRALYQTPATQPWTAEEDAVLLGMWRKKVRIHDMAAVLNRTEWGTENRLKRLTHLRVSAAKKLIAAE